MDPKEIYESMDQRSAIDASVASSMMDFVDPDWAIRNLQVAPR